MGAVMLDPANLSRVREDPARAVPHYRAILPALLPKLVDDFEIFVGDIVAVVVRALFGLSMSTRGAVEIASDDIPPNAPLGEMIERGHAAGEKVRRLVSQIRGHPEAEMLGHQGHRRDEQHGIVERNLNPSAKCRVWRAAIDVVGPQDIGKEKPVELPPLEQSGKLGPISEAVVFTRSIGGMAPKAGRLMHGAIHRKGVEENFLGHVTASPCAAAPFRSANNRR